VKDAPAGAKDVRLFRNGSLVKVWRGDVLQGKADAMLEATIPVVVGENRLTAYAFNRDNVKSADATLDIKGADSLKRAGTAYVLAVGVNDYENAQYNLKYAAADAQDFAEEVRRQQTQLGKYERVESSRAAVKRRPPPRRSRSPCSSPRSPKTPSSYTSRATARPKGTAFT